MAFLPHALRSLTTGFGESCAQRFYTYECNIDDLATISADGYFPADELLLKSGDLIFFPDLSLTPSMAILMVTEPFSATPVGGIYEGEVKTAVIINTSGGGILPGPDTITTAMLQDSAVTYAKLSSDITGVTAEHSGPATAATSTAFTVTGVDTNDVALATMTAGFSQPIVGTVCTADTVTVHFAAAALITDTVEILVIGNHNE